MGLAKSTGFSMCLKEVVEEGDDCVLDFGPEFAVKSWAKACNNSNQTRDSHDFITLCGCSIGADSVAGR